MICYYHKDCNDGFGSALAVWQEHKDCHFIDLKPSSFLSDCHGEDVFILDLSFSEDKYDHLLDVCNKAKTVTFIDHHETSSWMQNKLFPDNFKLIFNQERSAAALTWMHLHQYVPPLIERIEDRDIWKFRCEDTKHVCAGLGILDKSFDVWDEYLDYYEGLVISGKAIDLYSQKYIEKAIKEYRLVFFEGFTVPMLNVDGPWVSETGHALAQDYPFVLMYSDDSMGRKWSLRSKNMNIEPIARKYGGGGHQSAAGFRTDHAFMPTLKSRYEGI